MFNNSTKEEVKLKSTFQYQITHFKMLTIEKQKLPSAQQINDTKIMKIKNSKRLKDLKQTFCKISSKSEDLIDIKKTQILEKKLGSALEDLKSELNIVLQDEMVFIQDRNKLNKLIEEKNELENLHRDLEVKIRRADFTRRFSMKLIESSLVTKLRRKSDKTPRLNLNGAIINCIRRLERIEKIAENSKNCKLYDLHTKIIALESKISMITSEKEELLALNSLDEIEKTFESSIQQISDEVNFIKREYEKVSRLNKILSSELIKEGNKEVN